MINQQLLDYIRLQLSSGVGKEEIGKALATHGWNEQDIDGAFVAIGKVSLVPQITLPTASPATTNNNTSSVIVENKIWSKGIPRGNMIIMIISLILVFGLDLVILIDNPTLAPFWFAMLGVFGIFGIFYYIENRIFKQKFKTTLSKKDKQISLLIGLRDMVFLLNFIPFIQILGGIALMYGGIPYLFTYYFLLRHRWKETYAN